MSDIVRVTKSLTAAEVEAAFRAGQFPMGHERPPAITWHQPLRRAILPLDQMHISRSLSLVLRQHKYQVTFNQDFAGVMDACASRPDKWITADIHRVYRELHASGKAHSVEIWVDGQLAGGLYGVHLGGAFFAESKFHRRTNMSKVAVAELAHHLRAQGFALLEVQYLTPHLAQFGVTEIADRQYRQLLKTALALDCRFTQTP